MSEERTMQQLIQDMLYETDKLALLHFQVGTPEYNLQQDMIRNAAYFRINEYEKNKKENV